jgi:putative phosphoserine phosphatase/1-acylglycerol-3-phosphate O-acyltransferase
VVALVHPPTVRVRVGPPVDLAHESLDEDTERIMAAIVDLLPDEARQERVPTEDELAKTYPPGHKDE